MVCGQVAAEKKTQLNTQPNRQSNFRILLVEDDPGDVELIQVLLSEVENWAVTLKNAPTLAEAIALLQENGEIDVVLLDLSLPDEFGLETFRQVHAQFPLLPVVVLTGNSDDRVAMEALAAGAQDYLIKGEFSGRLLMRSTQYAVERQRQRQQQEQQSRKLAQALAQLKATQAQLVESEKMVALGSLVAGVAHEINTPLGIGVTASSTLAEKTAEFSQIYHSGAMKRSQLTQFLQTAQQTSSIILSNLNRAAELVQSFKQVAVDQSSESQRPFQLKEYLQETLTALGPKFTGTKHTVAIWGEEDLTVDSYPGALSQIVTNLVINSLVHAYSPEDRGSMVIEFQPACGFYGKGEEIILSYTDDGQGMTPETKEKIFDPFFTTKRGQGGSGLGLHLVYNLVSQKLQGTITCESQVGVGTKFTITFPAQIS